MVSFGEIHEFLQLTWIGHFGINWSFSTLETVICRKYSFQKLLQFSQGNNVLDAHDSSKDGFLFSTLHVFHQLSWIGLYGTNEPSSCLKILICRKYSFQKLTQWSQGNNVLDATDSNIDVFFGELYVFLQLSWIVLFGTKWASFHLENYDLQKIFLSKLKAILTGKQCARCSCF
jgi:hypothetical protein